jgi:hypothetical protein
MVKQMLIFARGGEAIKTIIQPDKLIKEMCKIVSETFPKSIQCRSHVEKSSWSVSGTSTQLHQVLLNLCVNARDAMPQGGILTLSTENAAISTAEALRHGVEPGNYLCIIVADTGEGIQTDLREKIFKPFFTTKGLEKGTGLGLSTCKSIVKSHDGFIEIESKVGAGSKFKVYLPASDSKSEPAALQKITPPAGNGERILIVDDEESILAITRAALQNFGYEVLVAGSGIEAVTAFSKNPDSIKLVISDLAMPLMDGRTAIAELRKIKPDIKIIISSGTEKEIEEVLPLIKTDGVILKPFTNENLLETVYRVLKDKKVEE